jgi:hypothetical protein
VPASFVEQERRCWHTNVFRIHRLARADPSLGVRLLAPDRLAVVEDGVRLIAWFKLNMASEPVLFGTEADAPGTLFGPLSAHVGGACFPRWGSALDGSWRYEVLVAEFMTRPQAMPPLPGL